MRYLAIAVGLAAGLVGVTAAARAARLRASAAGRARRESDLRPASAPRLTPGAGGSLDAGVARRRWAGPGRGPGAVGQSAPLLPQRQRHLGGRAVARVGAAGAVVVLRPGGAASHLRGVARPRAPLSDAAHHPGAAVGAAVHRPVPLSYYVGYVREHAYGLTSQRFGKWMGDELKGLVSAWWWARR